MREHEFDAMFKAAFGMSDARYARFKVVCPGGGTADLIERLRVTTKDHWLRVCEQHAVERAQEACTECKDGDLLYRDGEYFWTLYGCECADALKAVGYRKRWVMYLETSKAFIAEIERIRDRRLGPPELRDDLDPETLGHSPTLGDLMEQRAAS